LGAQVVAPFADLGFGGVPIKINVQGCDVFDRPDQGQPVDHRYRGSGHAQRLIELAERQHGACAVDLVQLNAAPKRGAALRRTMFTDRLIEDTRHLALPVVHIDIPVREEALAEQVTRAFGLVP
jgi:hypothetical protein